MIYHITTRNNWKTALEQGWYASEGLPEEGYIHTSFQNQLPGVLQRYYHNKSNLVLLHIDESKVTSMIKFEVAPSVNEIFPHIYGQLNLDAVVNVSDL